MEAFAILEWVDFLPVYSGGGDRSFLGTNVGLTGNRAQSQMCAENVAKILLAMTFLFSSPSLLLYLYLLSCILKYIILRQRTFLIQALEINMIWPLCEMRAANMILNLAIVN